MLRMIRLSGFKASPGGPASLHAPAYCRATSSLDREAITPSAGPQSMLLPVVTQPCPVAASAHVASS
jgi:hypothetical protein